MRPKEKRRTETNHTEPAFIYACFAGISAFIISEMTYSSVEATWTAGTFRLAAHMGSYLVAWMALAVVFFLLHNLATGSKTVSFSLAAPWLLNAIFAGAALVFHIRAYIIVPITGLVAMWAFYRIMVFKDSHAKSSVAGVIVKPLSKIGRVESFLDTIRRKESNGTKKTPRPIIKT